jgi:hypothetical protein
MKPSRWCCEAKHSSYRFPHTLSIDHDECIMYYRRLCAHYIGEARRWMKVARDERLARDKFWCGMAGKAHASVRKLRETQSDDDESRRCGTHDLYEIVKRDGHPMDDAESDTLPARLAEAELDEMGRNP